VNSVELISFILTKKKYENLQFYAMQMDQTLVYCMFFKRAWQLYYSYSIYFDDRMTIPERLLKKIPINLEFF